MNATGSVLLDTSVVVDYLRQQDQSLIRQLEGTLELYLPLTALEHNLPLVTRDAHFSKVPNLSVLDW